MQGTNLALLHNAGLRTRALAKLYSYTSDFVNGTGDNSQSSGQTDLVLLRYAMPPSPIYKYISILDAPGISMGHPSGIY